MYRTDKCRGFTLIELLVVIAIISLLVSILLPSLTKAKELAQSAVCLSNLKSCGLTLVLYAQDHDEYYPTGNVFGTGDRWVKQIDEYNGAGPQICMRYGTWAPMYPEPNSMLLCPSHEYKIGRSFYVFTDYAFNGWLMGTDYLSVGLGKTSSMKLGEVPKPSNTFVLVDGADKSNYVAHAPIRFEYELANLNLSYSCTVGPVHGSPRDPDSYDYVCGSRSVTNILYADGSAKSGIYPDTMLDVEISPPSSDEHSSAQGWPRLY